MNQTPLPTTVRQAFKILDGLTKAKDKARFLSQSKDEFTLEQHFGLGMWIRNNWIYGPRKESEERARLRRACICMLAGAKEDEYLFLIMSPDEISGTFLGRYYDHLKRVFKK